ncbi:MAG: RloB family protein [Candidatus Delongbacteria bacterium]|jgi:hypothetical protein|nr:RloB family protein [Candidatus Delongbacteria bacterium]MDY0016759.1 RloB family protein [Candidatus Delongbacteria bacterium]
MPIPVNKRILILTEDEKSSKYYFNAFKKDEKLRRDLGAVSVDIFHPKDYSPLGLVNDAKERKKKAIRGKNKYDEIWIVLDRDGHANFDQALNTAQANQINVALSIRCFEYWVLLHYEYTTRGYRKCDEIINHIKKNHLKDYSKAYCCYEDLIDKVNTAIKHGEMVVKHCKRDLDSGIKIYDLAAYTNVHELVKKLIDPKKYWG